MAAMSDTSPPKNPRSDGYGYNPRCIKRDISNYLTQRDATTAKIAALITSSKTIGTFQDTMQSGQGVHSAGHFTVSGDPGSGSCVYVGVFLFLRSVTDGSEGPVMMFRPWRRGIKAKVELRSLGFLLVG